MKPIERVFQIFRSGRHTAMHGADMNFSEADIRDTAHFYSESAYSAPLVLGHPKNDAPAYGRVRSLFFKNGKLFAHAQVDSPLVQAVRDGRYRNVSASFFGPATPGNPVPGVWSLKHVGFLGATPPAVRGMDQLNFSDNDGCLCFTADCDLGACSTHEDIYRFAAPPGCQVDPATLPLYRLAEEYRRACPELSFTEAAIIAAPYVNPIT